MLTVCRAWSRCSTWLSRCLAAHQSSRDIESRMRSETRLKLFTLDADTQVMIIKQSSAPLFLGFAALPNVVPSIVLSTEARFLWNRARCEAVRGEVWQTRSGELQWPVVQSAELRGWERGRAHNECKTDLRHVDMYQSPGMGTSHSCWPGNQAQLHSYWRRCITTCDVLLSA